MVGEHYIKVFGTLRGTTALFPCLSGYEPLFNAEYIQSKKHVPLRNSDFLFANLISCAILSLTIYIYTLQ